MPKVTIVLPTFNRRDTILRAVKSAQAQTFADWELIVVDDGSTDGTSSLIEGIDARVRVIQQKNRGMTEARNAAIRAGTGEYCAFLDSDDEFMPHHLELCVAFLDAHPQEPSVSAEVLEDFGHGRVVHHYRVETSQWYPKKAAVVGSPRWNLPPGQTDDYLRMYTSREPIGDWGRAIIERLGSAQDAFHYRGRIFEHMRYDYAIAITASLIRRSVFDVLGLPEPRWRTGSDYHFLARLARHAPTNFLSVPTFIKHEFAEDGTLPSVGHIVTGAASMRFVREWQSAWDDLFWTDQDKDPELRSLRGLRHYWMTEMALLARDRKAARDFIEQAVIDFPRCPGALRLQWLIKYVPDERLAGRLHHWIERLAN